ncbi:sporulation YhaL family protein [Alteribacter aurantiacus]|uniref:sporulation YhaL family protein n=1 Tax=Alteribacter aurantiacus TaxID=254410 RepID=UPI000688F7E0|nr:sporulation YhaL family protein [Alteribacter aurantiacus]
MKRIKLVAILVSVVFIAFVVRIISMTTIGSFLLQVPGWVYFLYAGIVFCGYKAVQAFTDDKKKEQALIEQEGEILMKKVRESREKSKVGS